MRYSLLIICSLLLKSVIFAQNLYFPPTNSEEWETTTAESLQWSQSEIDELITYLDQEDSKALIILKEGRIVVEHYFDSFIQDSLWPWFSAGKSLQATLVGIAQKEGLISVNSPSSDYLGAGWSSLSTEKEALVTVRNHLTMTTGLDERFTFTATTKALLRYREDAGIRWVYHNAPYNLVSDMLETVTGETLNIYTNEALENPIGMEGFWLPSGFNTFYISTARDMARFGLLTLNKGIWDQTSVLDDELYYDEMLKPSQSLNPSYGYLWWLNGQESYIAPDSPESFDEAMAPNAPADLVLAAGSQGQFISIVPSEDLILIRVGNSSDSSLAPISFHNEIWKRMQKIRGVSTAVREDSFEPVKFSLHQNYPNPFNPVTRIEYSIQDGGNVSLKVFNTLGQEVATLVDSYKRAGSHYVSFDASSLKTGVYFYSLSSSQVTSTKKMLLLK